MLEGVREELEWDDVCSLEQLEQALLYISHVSCGFVLGEGEIGGGLVSPRSVALARACVAH